MYVLTSHGDYARETLASCEMITGKLDNFTTVSFHDPMGLADLDAAYAQAFADRTDQEPFVIVTDIPNGSPANAALQFQHEHPEVRVFSGLSLGLLLAIATGTPIDEAVVQARETLKELTLTGGRTVTSPSTDSADGAAEPYSGNPLINVRVDARLIHGQVATMWTRSLNATRIMIVDDQIVTSEVQKMTLKAAVPGGVHLSILTAAGAAQRILAGAYDGQRVFLLVRDPQALEDMVNAGVTFKEVNVGNISMAEGAKQVAKSVAVTPKDVAVFDFLTDHGVQLYHQMVPNDKREDFTALLKKGD